MAAAAGSIIGGVLGSANQAGQKENMNTNTGAQGGVANFGNQKPDIKQADVKNRRLLIQIHHKKPQKHKVLEMNRSGLKWQTWHKDFCLPTVVDSRRT